MAKPSEAQKEATLREQMAAGTKKRVEIASKHAVRPIAALVFPMPTQTDPPCCYVCHRNMPWTL